MLFVLKSKNLMCLWAQKSLFGATVDPMVRVERILAAGLLTERDRWVPAALTFGAAGGAGELCG